MFQKIPHRRRELLALLLTVPFPSIGAIMSLLIAPGVSGQIGLIICQMWLLVLPIAWLLGVDQQPLRIPKPKRRDWITGIVVGLLMFSIILVIYWLFAKQWINQAEVLNQVKQVGLISQPIFLMGCIYFALINSLIEEYIWRWFVYRRCEELISARGAVFLTAGFFTVHHIIVLIFYTDWKIVVLGTLAVFVAGLVWSESYRRYRSIWSSYVSHSMAGLAIYIAAWQILFGS
ncbi:MAG: CPBP family intramembrane metalloprotease [Scytolyngbya sp. HA4215-MV1]|nr:CPBP family intramembrane metalloprotease [Scytolyngbya sp. HA4215-MV1]